MQKKIITFHYTLKDRQGNVLQSSEGGEPFAFMEGARQIIPGLEKEMLRLGKGSKSQIQVACSEAYGQRREDLILKVSKDQLPGDEVSVGDQFKGQEGSETAIFTVTEISGAEVTLDGNHPLAGQDLVFDVEVTDIREATAEEAQHGHAHGPHSHH